MWLQDLRVTVRSLARTPGFTLAAITALTALTLGLGASTAIFSVVDAVLLKPLPYPDAERIVVFLSGPDTAAGRGGPQVPATVFNLLQQQAAGIQYLSAYRFRPGSLTGGATPEPLAVAMVSAGFFRLFGGRTSHGRTFLAEEDLPGGRPGRGPRPRLLAASVRGRSEGGRNARLGRRRFASGSRRPGARNSMCASSASYPTSFCPCGSTPPARRTRRFSAPRAAYRQPPRRLRPTRRS